MAFPPPFPNQMFSRMPPNPHGAQQQGGAPPYMSQKFGFFSPQTHPPPPPPMMLPGGIPLVIRPRFNMNYRKVAPAEPAFVPPTPVPVTTIFVGSITDKCHDSVIQEILGKCGAVCNWKRLQDSNGKFKAFGFCDFLHPDGARKALRVLKNYPLGDRRLNVKADEQTEKLLEEFAAKRAKASTESVANEEKEDNELRETIKQIIEEQAPELLELTPLEEDELPPAEESASVKQSETGSANGDKDQKAKRKRSRSSSSRRRKRSSSKSKHSKRSRSKKSRRRSSSASSSSSDSSHALSERSRKSKEKSSKHKKRSSRKRTPSSEDSDEVAEKRRLKKEIKQREESYLARLKKWEDREKRRAKQYEKDEEHEAQRQKTIAREAKKLRQFLEDYQDERDDPKYYKGSVLFERRRNYEREREADAKDRHDERKEMEEVKKMILKEKQQQQPPADEEQTTTASAKREAKEEEEMDSKEATWATVGEGQPKQEGSSNGNVEDMEDGNGNISATTTPRPVPSLPPPPAAEVNAKDSPTPLKKTIAIQPKTIAAPVNGVFQDDEEEEDTLHQIKKKIKPFEITREDRIQSLTPEERKKLIKDLISRIPTEREKLFEFTVSWEYLDEALMEQRVRPWINKKICEYIGEEEPSLVSFICEKITSRTGPGDTLQDLSMVLDDEAEVFMVKLWRLIVYESEAKRLGLNVLPSASNSSSK